jgi:hypothetical protein
MVGSTAAIGAGAGVGALVLVRWSTREGSTAVMVRRATT